MIFPEAGSLRARMWYAAHLCRFTNGRGGDLYQCADCVPEPGTYNAKHLQTAEARRRALFFEIECYYNSNNREVWAILGLKVGKFDS